MRPDSLSPVLPDWPASGRVRALATTRAGGVSQGPWHGLNLGPECGDDPSAVDENRRRLGEALPSPPCWLQQVHGTRVIHLDAWQPGIEADAAWTDRPDQVCAILTADCLPILIADRDGELVGAVHAGWRGLAGDILAAMIEALPLPPDRLLAWIGPSISAPFYEVDAPVRDAILRLDGDLSPCLYACRAGHWQADLKSVARRRLLSLGVNDVFDAKLCTAAEPQRFFSHRRDRGQSGRQASLIWVEPGRQ